MYVVVDEWMQIWIEHILAAFRPRRSHSAAACSDQTLPWTICPVHCGKTADRIRMPFGIIGRTGPGIKQVVGFGDRSTTRGTFGARHCNQWGLYGVSVSECRDASLFPNYFGQTFYCKCLLNVFDCCIYTYDDISYAITLYGLWRRRHVVGQPVLRDISVVYSCWIFVDCVLNLIILKKTCYYACSLLYLERLFCFTYQTYLDQQHVGMYLMTIDNLLTSLHLIYISSSWCNDIIVIRDMT